MHGLASMESSVSRIRKEAKCNSQSNRLSMGKQNREVAQDQPAILYLNNMLYVSLYFPRESKSQESKDSSGGADVCMKGNHSHCQSVSQLSSCY